METRAKAKTGATDVAGVPVDLRVHEDYVEERLGVDVEKGFEGDAMVEGFGCLDVGF